MIRRMAGILVEVGRHNLAISDVEKFLCRPSDVPARFTTPPSGLFFEQAFYDQEEFRNFLAEVSVNQRIVRERSIALY
jgi:tRNA pseudouridine38-40 synthase